MPTSSSTFPVILAIAGFDPSGGAGLIVDIRTSAAFDCTPVAALTSLTYQNSLAVFGAIHQTAESLRSQILPVLSELRITAVKIGMLPTRELVSEVARLMQETKMPKPIVDPVLRATSSYELMEPAAQEAWVSRLMPLARLITPNIPEAEALTGLRITNETGMREAARKLREMGARAVLIKGGHLREESTTARPTRQAIDILDDNGLVTVFGGEWIDSPPVRGTGCRLSTAIAAGIAHGTNLQDSVAAAKQFVADAIRTAKDKD